MNMNFTSQHPQFKNTFPATTIYPNEKYESVDQKCMFYIVTKKHAKPHQNFIILEMDTIETFHQILKSDKIFTNHNLSLVGGPSLILSYCIKKRNT